MASARKRTHLLSYFMPVFLPAATRPPADPAPCPGRVVPGTERPGLVGRVGRFFVHFLFAPSADAKAEREKKKRKEKQLRTKVRVKTEREIHVTLVGDVGSSKTTILKSFAQVRRGGGGAEGASGRALAPGVSLRSLQDATRDFASPFECVSYPVTLTGVKDKYVLRMFDTDPDELFSRIRAVTYKVRSRCAPKEGSSHEVRVDADDGRVYRLL